MESEKVKEIKKALECCSNPICEGNCHYHSIGCMNDLSKDALTLINELESDKDNLYNLNQNLISDKQVLMHENERLLEQRNKTYNIWVKETEELKDRIAELEKDNETKTDTITDLLKKQEFYEKEKLKQFAERLKVQIKAKVDYYNDEVFDYSYNGITEKDIDETLKEFLK